MEMLLAERLLLLVYDDTGTLIAEPDSVDYGLAAALLADLLLAGRVRLTDARLAVADPVPTGDRLLDDKLATIAADPAGRQPQEWVDQFSVGLRERLLDRLVERRVLRRQRDRVLWIFPRTRYPLAQPQPVAETRQRLQAAVDGTSEVDGSTAVLCALVRAARLVEVVFAGQDPAEMDRRLAAASTTTWPDAAVRAALASLESIIARIAAETAVRTVRYGNQ